MITIFGEIASLGDRRPGPRVVGVNVAVSQLVRGCLNYAPRVRIPRGRGCSGVAFTSMRPEVFAISVIRGPGREHAPREPHFPLMLVVPRRSVLLALLEER